MNLSDIDVVLFDLDGTVYYGSKIIPGANDTIVFFREHGKKIYFATNNSTKTRKQIFERLKNMGIDCRQEEVITSGFLAALIAKKRGMEDIYIFGSKNLINEFTDMGVKVNQNESADNLLIGYDPDMTYEGLTKALQVALKAKCIMACNRERIYPGENARMMPGCGAMTAPIEWCANRECDYIIGKPNTLMVEVLSDMESIQPSRFLVVGDTYESDIIMANLAGCRAVLISKDSSRDVLTCESIGHIPEIFE